MKFRFWFWKIRVYFNFISVNLVSIAFFIFAHWVSIPFLFGLLGRSPVLSFVISVEIHFGFRDFR